ncbi:50S ribosomal protein L22 [bacterium]|nr:50S ribosomal protein L22 [bacterium]
MPFTARLRHLRIAPRKVRLVADLIRGKKVEEAQNILDFTRKRAAQPILKLLKSAIANAVNNFQAEPSNLYISKITVDEGPKLKRWRPRAFGRVFEIQKKTSHITIVLDEIEKKPKKKKKRVKEIKKPKKIRKIKEKPKIEEKPEREKPKPELEAKKPIPQKGIRRFFRRKSF